MLFKLCPLLKFSKVDQSSRSRSQGKKLWSNVKGLVIRNTHVKYESPTSYGLKVMANVKVFQKWVKVQGQGQGTMWKVLS